MSEIQELNVKVDNLSQEILILSKKIDRMMEVLSLNQGECVKMGNHIDFVENLCETVKSPLIYFCEQINSYRNISGSLTEE